ncbi:MAG: Re/Si-specific NAD(P)(+) transhydrogenase subunit alpha [Myxococcales bacterium]|nr:Re/Si-specific NAD(P)(+) transhydrogenase subunit alpha [Myxococcales bacterium]MCB9539491.1 Re/Si-specific NAD(P)(+) transhydrogenase subunit alpha [Myxococcales bacterium]
MKVGIPKERFPGERRVAATPDSVQRLLKQGFAEVLIERGAGREAAYADSAYAEAGARLVDDAATVWAEADLILKVRPLEEHEVPLVREGQHLISFIWPAQNEALVKALAARGATVLAMDCVPRISRAQKMDALSSMANVAGYRAIIEAANEFGSFFAGQITAAGRVPPAKVLIIGAGVAGLAAIAAAKGLGAVVRAFDTREAVRDQVKSLGGEFLEVDFEESGEGAGGYAKVMSQAFIDAEMELFYEQAKEVDIVVTTALIPGRPAPKLWQARAVEVMKPGSVIVDLAAEQGGNCELTVPGERHVTENGVIVLGYTDLTSRLANTCSQLYATNLTHLLSDMGGGAEYHVDHDDEAVRGALVLDGGEMMWPPPAVEPSPPPKPKTEAPPAKVAEPTPPAKVEEKKKGGLPVVVGVALLAVWLGLRFGYTGEVSASNTFLQHLTVFVLACFVGWQVVWAVTAALHTPLMAVTNAISGIIIVGGILQTSDHLTAPTSLLGAAAVLLATINIAGGFLVTQRMLKMFRK